jgi:hypothetical protein
MKPEDEQQQAHFLSAGQRIKRFLENPGSIKVYQPLDIPAGPPIGSGAGWRIDDFCSWSMER